MIITPRLEHPVRQFGGVRIDLSQRIAVMAIVNRTRDSFYDRGRTFELDLALQAGADAFAAGADLLDIGGVKFAPGPVVSPEDEAALVLPLVRDLSQIGPVSVDTFHASVAEAALEAGASIINDTTGVHDPRLADAVSASDAHLVIAHSIAEPRTKLVGPTYDDVVAEANSFLAERVKLAMSRGVPRERLIVDPGHDLNKNTLHTLELTRRLDSFTSHGLPLLVALSNKDFIGETLDRDRGERLAGSLAAAAFCVTKGARIVRVHNVPETVDAMRMLEGIAGWREPAFLAHNMTPGQERGSASF